MIVALFTTEELLLASVSADADDDGDDDTDDDEAEVTWSDDVIALWAAEPSEHFYGPGPVAVEFAPFCLRCHSKNYALVARGPSGARPPGPLHIEGPGGRGVKTHDSITTTTREKKVTPPQQKSRATNSDETAWYFHLISKVRLWEGWEV